MIAAGLLVYLKLHAVEMVHAVVVNAVIQRLPDGYPEEPVRQVFVRRLQDAKTAAERDRYLEQLKELSLRLEKVQFLDEFEVEEILEEIRSGDSVLR